jgi:hypothetical protein
MHQGDVVERWTVYLALTWLEFTVVWQIPTVRVIQNCLSPQQRTPRQMKATIDHLLSIITNASEWHLGGVVLWNRSIWYSEIICDFMCQTIRGCANMYMYSASMPRAHSTVHYARIMLMCKSATNNWCVYVSFIDYNNTVKAFTVMYSTNRQHVCDRATKLSACPFFQLLVTGGRRRNISCTSFNCKHVIHADLAALRPLGGRYLNHLYRLRCGVYTVIHYTLTFSDLCSTVTKCHDDKSFVQVKYIHWKR